MTGQRRLVAAAVILLLLAFLAQVWTGVRMNSPTFDEPYHIVRAYVYLKTGDSTLLARGGHPPFVNLLNVLPLLYRDVRIPAHQPGWANAPHFRDLFQVADQFLWRIGNDVEAIMLSTRATVVVLSLVLALLVFAWARDLYGNEAGLLALLLYAFDPNVIAHSGVVTTDLGAALFIFLSVRCLYLYTRKPSWQRLLATGVVLGVAQASKFSALFLVPIFGILLLAWQPAVGTTTFPLVENGVTLRARLRRVALLMAVILLVGGLVVWAVHGFAVAPLLPREERHPVLDRFLPQGQEGLRRLVYVLVEHLPVPAPAYWADLAWLSSYAQAGHPSFLMGQHGVTGWWFYFPVALAIKTPLPTLALLAAALVLALRRRCYRDAFLAVPVAVLFLASMFSSIDIGYRNIVPMLPFAFVLIGKMVAALQGRAPRVVLAGLLVWNIAGSVAIYPHHLAYFNELVGGPRNGYKYLVDSNLDWGQDLRYLKQYMDERGIERVYLNYFGVADPAFYGIAWAPMPDRPPASGAPPAYYALSVTSLQGVYAGGATTTHWLAEYTAIDHVGHSILIYRLP